MGRFKVELAVANYEDVAKARRKELAPEKVRRLTLPGVVDSGAVAIVLPLAVVRQLGLPATGRTKVKYANGQVATRDTVDGVHVELLGRHGTYSAVVEPKRRDALIGAVVLEQLDFLIDCRRQRLVPRDPEMAVNEIE